MTTATLSAIAPFNPVPLKQDAAVIGLVGLAHGTSHFSHLLLAPLFPVFMRDFGLSFSDVGLLMTLFFVISGSGQAVAGFVVDRMGARPVLFAAVTCFLLAALAASQATGYTGLLLVAMLAGLGNAPFHPADFTILNQRVSPARLGHAFSAHGLTGNLGWALAPVFLVGITALADWRVAYYAAALLYAAVLGVLFWQRDKLRTDVAVRQADAPKGAELAYLKLPVVWWCFAFFLLSTMTLAVVQNFAPSILKALHGVSVEVATFTISAYMLCGALGMLVGGFVAAYGHTHRWSSDRVVAISMSSGALLLLLCATGWLGAVGTMVALAATGFAVGVGGPSRDLMIKKATPKGATGRVYGTVYSGLDVGFAISPLVFGAFMDRGWYALTLAGAAVVLAISVVAVVGVGSRTA
ncbi:MAG: MFS transporter [Hydrogenophaga sp.]|uniref:MFS transporter n=1 Tax=Hydrogenophaga sp. TaxID=1904254 RepID=UPI001BB8B35B|nr:MFS transporter [Hydrogenophaga sp.]MBS3912471.1 MFS transporter [Hydrogenophaga sp.]MDO9148052.1 MFS transporter [Hydrogenophaga sp.]MDO9603677.1 MFS transporter [Hydrogenophaga sp.]MDP2164861.1 MFS transporter [Hydrogenophaga sp.]MDP3475313.1 MFS transporter [Hydrogenophaga sp.]